MNLCPIDSQSSLCTFLRSNKIKTMSKILVLLIILASSLCGSAQENVVLKFSVDASALKNVKNFGIRGSVSPLSWEKTYFLQDTDLDGVFEGEVIFSKKTTEILEYKYVCGDKSLFWEMGRQNRILVLNRDQIQLQDQWGIPNEFDLKSLPKLSSEQLTTDFTILKKTLLTIHPGLYRYRTKFEMDSIFDHFQSVFSQPLSYQEAFLNLTRMTSAIQCGHTFTSFYNQNGLLNEVVLNQKDKLPFVFRVLNEKMIITESIVENHDLPRGTEILAIDGVSTPVLLKETASLVKADGANDAKRYADLNTFGVGDYFEVFDCYFPLLFPPNNQQYRLKIKKPNSDHTEDLNVSTVSRLQRKNALINQNPDHPTKADQLWKFEFWDNNTAYLQLGTFDVFQLSFEWREFLKNAFDEIRKRKTKNLVLDIRWNEGGQDEVLLFIGQNITKELITIPQRNDLVRYNKISSELKPHLSTWDNTFFDLSQRTKPYNNDYFLLTGANTTAIKPFNNAFEGNIYLLVNASNSSATFYFAEIAKENKLATLIGETTGGSQKGLNAGTMFFLRLPNSQIEVDIPIVGTFSDHKPFGGIQPDIVVTESYEDIVKGEDKVLIHTKSLIQRK